MTKAPYPGFSPNFRVVDKTAGYVRNCVVIELRTLGSLDNIQQALIQEQLEATVERLSKQIPIIEGVDIVLRDRFDPVLKKGLRLS